MRAGRQVQQGVDPVSCRESGDLSGGDGRVCGSGYGGATDAVHGGAEDGLRNDALEEGYEVHGARSGHVLADGFFGDEGFAPEIEFRFDFYLGVFVYDEGAPDVAECVGPLYVFIGFSSPKSSRSFS